MATYEAVAAANASDLNGAYCDSQGYLYLVGPGGNRVGRTVLRLIRLTDIVTPGASERAVFVDTGRMHAAFYVPYSEPRWHRAYAPPIHHAGGATLSFADAHAEYWKWSRETVNLPRKEYTIQYSDDVVFEKLTGDGQPQTEEGLRDLQKTQRAIWGRLGYPPDMNP